MRQDGSDDGLRPPPDLAWQMGKTAPTIRFVREAETALSEEGRLGEYEARLLSSTVQRMKRGQEVLNDFETVDEWLERLHDHHP